MIATQTVIEALRRYKKRASNPNIKTYMGEVFIRRIQQGQSGLYKIEIVVIPAGRGRTKRCKGKNLSPEASEARIREVRSEYSEYSIHEVTDSYE